MNRKLHNSLLAMTASTACLAAALVLGKPVNQAQPTHYATPASAAQSTQPVSHAASASSSARSTSKRSLSVAIRLPFFAFLPRG
jgi:hypothetical protein